MKTYIDNHAVLGKLLFVENGDIKLGIALEFGIRISYLSYKGSENLFFVQPKEMTTELATEEGWRVYGGHRLWFAPESDKDYYPDNSPITYEILDDKIIVYQQKDEWLDVKKSIEISFESDNIIKLVHHVQNVSTKTCRFSPWAVTSLDAGGTELIPLTCSDGGCAPVNKITTWYYTSLGDERVEYSRELIKIKHKATSKKYKIGVGHPDGSIKYINKGVIFEKIYDVKKDKEYPDGDVSFETFLCDHMIEMETLSPLCEVKPLAVASHEERWRLTQEKK